VPLRRYALRRDEFVDDIRRRAHRLRDPRNATGAQHARQSDYQRKASERAAGERQRRLRELQASTRGFNRAVEQLVELTQEQPAELVIRRRFVRLPTPRPAPQESDERPMAERINADVQSRPPCSALVHRPSLALSLYLSALLEAQARTPKAGALPARSRRPLVAREGWATLLGYSHLPAARRRERLRRALDQLEKRGLVLLGPARTHRRYDDFELQSDDGEGRNYTVPGKAQSFAVPLNFFTSGWHLVLEPREIATWLMLKEMTDFLLDPEAVNSDGVGVAPSQRHERYGITSEVYEAHRELTELGLLETIDTVPGRRHGRIDPSGEDTPSYLETLRFHINKEALSNNALEVALRQFKFPIAPRYREELL
jgi:hypothetical protein